MVEQNVNVEGMKSDLNTANIMVVGKTGTGKSTLLNAIFGEEVAATGTGEPVTEHIDEYKHKDIPIHIWDTVGLELNAEKTKKSIEEIKKTIATKSESKDELDRIHAIWYCINSTSNRYEGAELGFIKDLYSIGVPFTIVLTQCYGAKKKITEFEEQIKRINQDMGLDNVAVIKVLAQDYEVEIDEDTIVTKPSFGLDELVGTTLDLLPEYVQSGFIAAQKVSETLKHAECEKLIWTYVERVKSNYWSKSKIVNWDNVPLINILTTDAHIKNLFSDISKIYNTEIEEEMLEKIMVELGGLSPEKAIQGLLNPISIKFDANVELKYQLNKNGEYDDDYMNLTKDKRVARMIVLYGYTFLESVEKFWERIRKEKLETVKTKTAVFVDILRESLKEMWTKQSVEK